MIKFKSIKNEDIIDGEIRYSEKDRSFDFSPKINLDINIAIAYLNLGFDSEAKSAQLVWGFSPKKSWKSFSEKQPISFNGDLILLSDCEPGLTYRIDKEKMWKSYYNNNTGWYCIGDKNQKTSDINVQFATNIIAVLQNDILKAIWLKPVFF